MPYLHSFEMDLPKRKHHEFVDRNIIMSKNPKIAQYSTCLHEICVLFIDAPLNFPARVDTFIDTNHVVSTYRSDFSSRLKLENRKPEHEWLA